MIKKEKLKNREFDVHTRKIGQQNKIGEKWGFFFLLKKNGLVKVGTEVGDRWMCPELSKFWLIIL